MGSMKKKILSFPKLPKLFCIVWRTPKYKQFNIRLNETHHTILSIYSSLCEHYKGLGFRVYSLCFSYM
jgi:hypothetical protein